jgi:uncharacterized protein (DUF305 family)
MMKHLLLSVMTVSSLALAGCSDQPSAENDMAQSTNMAGHDMGGSNGMTGMGMSAPAPTDSAATKGYKQSMNAMMSEAPAYTGDADVDFMQQMRVHHQAAIAMSETQLEHGSDAEARTLAEQIIAEQRREIAEIDRWLASRQR